MFKKYDAYKDSGVEWIGQIPEHWEITKNKYLFEEVNIRSKGGEEDLPAAVGSPAAHPR